MFAQLKPYKILESGIELQVKVTPKATKERIGDVFTDPSGTNVLKIYVTIAPEDGKANRAVITLLAKKLGICKTSINITKGQSDQRKTLLIKNLQAESALRMIT